MCRKWRVTAALYNHRAAGEARQGGVAWSVRPVRVVWRSFEMRGPFEGSGAHGRPARRRRKGAASTVGAAVEGLPGSPDAPAAPLAVEARRRRSPSPVTASSGPWPEWAWSAPGGFCPAGRFCGSRVRTPAVGATRVCATGRGEGLSGRADPARSAHLGRRGKALACGRLPPAEVTPVKSPAVWRGLAGDVESRGARRAGAWRIPSLFSREEAGYVLRSRRQGEAASRPARPAVPREGPVGAAGRGSRTAVAGIT